MSELSTFISKDYRPDITGASLDETHKSYFNLFPIEEDIAGLKTIHINAICFGVKKDRVLLSLEHAIEPSNDIIILFYEDIHKRWSYIADSKDSYFVFKKNDKKTYKLKPNCIYIRGCYVNRSNKMWRILGEFFNFIDIWGGKVLCSPSNQINNESKLYQLKNSICKSAQKYQSISIGQSYVVKGLNSYRLLKKNRNFIVKSLSGIRSIVADESQYSTWNQENIANLPVLFQKKACGNDIRVHIISQNIYAKIAGSKEKVDYRYDDAFFSMHDLNEIDKEIVLFCQDVANEEKNNLLGIDFIKENQTYVALEANPSPGWSAYHECNGIEIPSFVKDLIMVLTNGNN